jgi:sulfotransferase family protein
MRKPDFFIVGAPRCGTTAMYTYLRQHPDIFMSARKESHFFGTDISSLALDRDEQKYLALFAGAQHEKRVGEASVFYLSSRRAAREIHAFCPSASIVIMLRNPVDMMYSLHSFNLFMGAETISDFRTALMVEEERKRGLQLPAKLYPVKPLLYREVATYRPQIQRYLDVFGGQSVHVILFDDFTNATARVYREICEFLGVSPDFQPEFPVVNANKRVRSQAVRNVLRSPPSGLGRRLVKAMLPWPVRQRLFKGLRHFNVVDERRRPLNPHLRRQLQAEFAPEVEQLSRLLRRDLRHWCAT